MPISESPSLEAQEEEWDDLGQASTPKGIKRTPSWTSDGNGGVDVSDPLGLEGFVMIVDGEDVTILDTVRHHAESVPCPSCAGDESALVQNLGKLLGDYVGKRHQSPQVILLENPELEDIPEVRFYDVERIETGDSPTFDEEHEEIEQGVTPTPEAQVVTPVPTLEIVQSLLTVQPGSTPFVESSSDDDSTIDEILSYTTSHSVQPIRENPLGENAGDEELILDAIAEDSAALDDERDPTTDHSSTTVQPGNTQTDLLETPPAKPKLVAVNASILGRYPLVMPIRGFKGMSIPPHILVRLTAAGGDPGDEYFGLSNRPCAGEPGNVRIFFSPSTMEEVD